MVRGVERGAAAVSEDVFDFVDASDYDVLIEAHDALCRSLDALWASRRLRRDHRLAAVAERLRVLIDSLWSEDDGHSDYGYDGPNLHEWDDVYPLADACVHDAASIIAAWAEAVSLLRELVRSTDLVAAHPPWRHSEVHVRPPSYLARSEPDLALAPPAVRVALFSDDATTAAA